MKKILVLLAIACPIVAYAITKNKSSKNNNDAMAGVEYVEKYLKVKPCERISIAGSFNVRYTQGNKMSVKVSAPENIMPYLIIDSDGKTLRIRTKSRTEQMKKGNWKSLFVNMRTDKVTVYVTSPDLIDVSMAGSGEFESEGKLDTDNLNVHIAGSGDVRIADVICNTVKASIAGSGDLKLKKVVAGSATLSIAGSGDVNAHFVKCGSVNASIAGSGDITLSGTVGALKKSVAGSGDFHLGSLKLSK